MFHGTQQYRCVQALNSLPLDTETGFYYLQSRYYDPETGRFLNADNLVITEDPLGANLFAYCGNNPIEKTDPTGHIALVDDLIIAGCVILIFGSVAGIASIGSQSQSAGDFESPSISLGDLIIGMDVVLNPTYWTVYFAAEHTKRNGSKKKTNDKHTKPRPGRSTEKKKQKKGWTPRSKNNGLLIDGDWIYNNKDLNNNSSYYEDIPNGYFPCTNPLHNACIGYHAMIL